MYEDLQRIDLRLAKANFELVDAYIGKSLEELSEILDRLYKESQINYRRKKSMKFTDDAIEIIQLVIEKKHIINANKKGSSGDKGHAIV
ncbi:MAG: hypothetical protein PF440_03750 [Thiomicrorhabdus sp.]|jgi:hypothetical protein|nr:hypothetical protein [Thiomicrorhabdus sp.]